MRQDVIDALVEHFAADPFDLVATTPTPPARPLICAACGVDTTFTGARVSTAGERWVCLVCAERITAARGASDGHQRRG
jgi:hypothetical protein